METEYTPQDPTEKALMDEFGAYLGAIAEGFTSKVQSSMQATEEAMLARIGGHADEMEILHRQAAERAEAQHRLVEDQIQSFSTLIYESQGHLELARRNFETTMRTELVATLQQESASLHSLIDSVSLALEGVQTIMRYVAAVSTLALLIAVLDLWKHLR